MTIKQYQKLAAAVAKKINALGGNPSKVRYLKFPTKFEVGARDPNGTTTEITSGDENTTIVFDTINNPNNPNAAYRTLKPGSMSLFNSETRVNVDASDYNYDSAQFADLIDAIETEGWMIDC